MVAGARLVAAIRLPPTASARLRNTVVVATIWMRSRAKPGDIKPTQAAIRAKRQITDLEPRRSRPRRGAAMVSLTLGGARHPDALRHQAVDVLLGLGNGANTAIHRHAG